MVVMTALAIGVALFGLAMAALLLYRSQTLSSWLGAILFVVFGVGGGWWTYATDQQLRRETLFEVMAPGSIGLEAGTAAPVREFAVEVEHPGVEHDLLIAPFASVSSPPRGDVELSVTLLDPQKAIVLEDRSTYTAYAATESDKADWDAHTLTFTPTQKGTHQLRLTILSVGIPQIHLRVADPQKTDGKRIPGF